MGTIREGALDLADGRRLGYAGWGPSDAPPVIYCHGSPGNRLELTLAREVLERRGVTARVVAFDRPGYGLSTFQRMRYLDWTNDVVEAASRIGIDRFGLLGASGGAPYALACGYLLADRVTRIGIVVGSGPVEAMGMKDSAAHASPYASPLRRRILYEGIALAFKAGGEGWVVERSITMMGEADRAAMARPEVRRWFTTVFREAVVQGGRAAAYEAGLLLRPWGFDFNRIETPVDLWYGGEDRHVPAEVGQWLAERLPNARYTVWPQHGHFTWALSDEVADVVATVASPGAG